MSHRSVYTVLLVIASTAVVLWGSYTARAVHLWNTCSAPNAVALALTEGAPSDAQCLKMLQKNELFLQTLMGGREPIGIMGGKSPLGSLHGGSIK